jgi:hypothetical protein
MHRKRAPKQMQNHRAIALRNKSAPSFHRKSTDLSTVGMIHATGTRNPRTLMHSCATFRYDSGVGRD